MKKLPIHWSSKNHSTLQMEQAPSYGSVAPAPLPGRWSRRLGPGGPCPAMVDAVIHNSQGPQGRLGRVIVWVFPLTEGHNQRDWEGSQVLPQGICVCFLSICDTFPDMHISPSGLHTNVTSRRLSLNPLHIKAHLLHHTSCLLYSLHSTYHHMTYLDIIYFVYVRLSSIRKLAPWGLFSQHLDQPGT